MAYIALAQILFLRFLKLYLRLEILIFVSIVVSILPCIFKCKVAFLVTKTRMVNSETQFCRNALKVERGKALKGRALQSCLY